MACDLSLGRLEPCKNSNGGLKSVYFITSGLIDPSTVVYGSVNTDAIASITGTITGVKYDLKGTNSFEQTIVSSRENGTTYFDQKLSLSLKKLTVKDHKELKLLAMGRPQVIVEDNNGNFFFAGLVHGLEVTGGTIVTGTALADHSGYTLEISGSEPVPANFLEGAISTVIDTITTGV
jgi:hypothetical protein